VADGSVTLAPLSICLFGPFEARVNGAPLPRLRSRKGQWLLALLALRAGREVQRTWLVGMLWPDSPEAAALASLRSSLKDLRRALGAESARLRSPTPHTLALDLCGADADVLAFDAAIASGDPAALARAVSLYRGPFLEGCEEPWAFEARQVRERAYLGALEALATQALADGDPTSAEHHLRRALAVDPLRESAHRTLMQALAAGGNYAAALLAYRELRLLLHRELNAEPDSETTALFEQIRSEASLRSSHSTPSPPSFLPDAGGSDGLRTRRREGAKDAKQDESDQSCSLHSSPISRLRGLDQSPGLSDLGERRTPGEGSQVALLYKRNAQPDERLLKLLETELWARGFHVFVDRHLTIGVEWAQEIERQVRAADAVVPLLSAASIQSEMLQYEVQIAREAAQQQGRPRLLPVRIAETGPLPEALAAVLDPLEYALWEGPQDDARLVEALVSALSPPPGPRPSEQRRRPAPEGGPLPLDSAFYVERPTDAAFQAAVRRHDSIVLVKGARQMGKTSLLARGLQQAREAGDRVVVTDLQRLTATDLASAETLYVTLAGWIAEQLELDVFLDQVWSPRLGPSGNFERYLRRQVLGKAAPPLVWGLDEVDALGACSFGSEVFALFRSLHGARSLDPDGPWDRLTLAMAYATEPHLFIQDIHHSPFNVGTRVTLDDFSLAEVAELNRRYDRPLRDEAEVARYAHLLGGHPYLVHRGLQEMAKQGIENARFEAQADRDDGLFGDHLKRLLVLLVGAPELREAVQEVLRGRPCPSASDFFRLRSAGVLAGGSARDARLRCPLYATYLERHLL
jgi:DNA-binding SARP family transcriptional activator